MAAAAERRHIIRILLESNFYCGTVYRMPLRERLELVKSLEKRFCEDGRDGQQAHHQQGGRSV